MTAIPTLRHPYYEETFPDWDKWRRVYNGGQEFIDYYLKPHSSREDSAEFEDRKCMAPTPCFSTAAINEIVNAISQRLSDVNRRGGSKTYDEAVAGRGFGVDLHGASMNNFIQSKIIADLCIVKRVGVYVDGPSDAPETMLDAIDYSPYVYVYKAEDILAWKWRKDRPDEFQSLLLRDFYEVEEEYSGLPCESKVRYRFYWIGADGFVHVKFYTEEYVDGNITYPAINMDGQYVDEDADYILDINIIPFAMGEISKSLMENIANHQISLLNLESSDIAYCHKSNVPFYTEQQDTRASSDHLRGPSEDGTVTGSGEVDKEIKVGVTRGRIYGKDVDRPDFIAPPSEPLEASMAKQQQLKADIRQLLNLTLNSVRPVQQSAASKAVDQQSSDSGLSAIGFALEALERKIAKYWTLYEPGTKPATVKYPEKYSLKTDADRREEAKSLKELRQIIPSATYQKAISTEIATMLLGPHISAEMLDKIKAEIDAAPILTADPDTLFEASDRGVLDLELVAETLGASKATVEKAAKQHAERLARINEAQSKDDGTDDPAARGVGDLDDNPGAGGTGERQNARRGEQLRTGRDPVRGRERKPQL